MRHIKKLIPNDKALLYLRGCNPFQFADRVTKLVGDCLDQINEFYNVLSTVEDGKDGKDGKDGEQGPMGPAGPQGPQGPQGNNGVGVPPGGNVGQYLKKKSNSNYDTEWSDVQGGGSGNVNSVNNKTGDVVLSAEDVNALPSDTPLFSGDYNDLTNKPTIPAEQVQSDWNQTNNSSKAFIKNKPTIPTVPTNVSAFSNDAGYLTQHQSLSDYVQKSQTAGLIKNDGTIDTNTYLTQHQDISGKANKSEMSVVNGTGADADKTTITLKNGTSATVIKQHQDISRKQDELVSGNNIKTVNGQSLLGSGNITIQGGGGGGDVNIIESITFNGNAVPVDSNKNAAISYTAPVTSVNGNTGAVTVSVPTKVSDLTNDSGFISSYTETDPVFIASAAYGITSSDIANWNGKQDALPFNTTPTSINKVATMSDIPSSLPANGGNAATVNNHTVAADVPSGAVFTDTTYSVMGASGQDHASGLVPDTPSTAGTAKFLREDGTWEVPAISVETVSGTTVTQELASNKFYSFGEVNSLTVTLGSIISGVSNEYTFEFDSGNTATTLGIPATVKGIDAAAIKANKHYEVSIKYDASNQNYYGLIQEW